MRCTATRLIGTAIIALVCCGAANAATPFAVQQVAPGDYVHFGEVAIETPQNRGDIANLGIVVGRDAVAVVDTGGSVAVGGDLLAAVRRITDKPIRYVINTVEHPDHVFGDAAFAGLPGVVFVGHHNLPRSLAERGAFFLRSYARQIGAAAIARVRIIPPTLLVQSTTILQLGGRALLLTAWSPPAHSDCDLTVLDQATGTLFAGDLLSIDQTPVVDASLAGFLSVLPRLAKLPAVRVVPGHGQAIGKWPQALDAETRYLGTLAADAKRLVAAGVSMAQAVPQIGRSERKNWALFDFYNPRNATLAFSEAEWR